MNDPVLTKLNTQPDLCLILASCIQVADANFLRPQGRHDTNVRLQDTLTALDYWLNKQTAIVKLVFIDNSGYDLTPLQEFVANQVNHGKQIEFISFQTVGYSPEKGRSYGELDIMKKAITSSELLKTTTHFAKVNARVMVSNSDRILSILSNDCDIVGRLSHNLTWFSTVFFAFQVEVFKQYILPYSLTTVNDVTGQYIERIYSQAVLKCIANDLRWYPFIVEPCLQGYMGLDNRSYSRSFIKRKIVNGVKLAYDRAFDNSTAIYKQHPQTKWQKKAMKTRDEK